jgi:hypothetical protein
MRNSTVLVMALFLGGLTAAACKRSSKPAANLGQLLATDDQDGDGIPDSWETSGVDYTYPPDGSLRHLDLKRMGASPRHKDIFVWVVWMEDASHTHLPSPEALQIVEKAFANATLIKNLDGYPGINLHIVLAPEPIPERAILGSSTTDANGDLIYYWSDFDDLKSKYFPKELADIFHFCVFAHDIDKGHHSGITKTIPGRDFIVALGGFTARVGTNQEKAGTLMHELGHALGLRHGGSDDTNYKPNYISVMNYFFQMNGVMIDGSPGTYTYSTFALDANEAMLNETVGLTKDLKLGVYGTKFWCCKHCKTSAGTQQEVRSLSGATDWNCNGVSESQVSTDINGDDSVTALTGFNDWQAVVLKASTAAGVTGAAGPAAGTRVDELTPAEADRLPLPPVTDVRAKRKGNGITVKWRGIPLDRVFAYRVYRASGNGGVVVPVGTIDNADNTQQLTFTDINVPAGSYGYAVTAVYAPHSYHAEGEGELGSQPPGVRTITALPQLQEIRNGAPVSTGAFETLGVTGLQSRAAFNFPKQLLETEMSQRVVVVKSP